MYVCVCMYTHAYMHTYMYTFISIPICVCIYVCMYVYIYIYIYIYIGRHALGTHLRQGAVPVLTPQHRRLVRVCGRRGRARGAGRLATSVCGLKILVFGSLSY